MRIPWSTSAYTPDFDFVWLCRDKKRSEIKCAITDENATIDPLLAQSCKNLPPLEYVLYSFLHLLSLTSNGQRKLII